MLERLTTSIRRLRSGERGSSLVPVIITIIVVAALGLTFFTLIASSMSTTSAARASVQSTSAAEAGVETAVNHVDKGCTSTRLTGDDPEFVAEIRFSDAEDPNEVNWDALPLSCPEAVDGWVHLRATGQAAEAGMNNSTGDERTAEAVYEWIAPETPEERLGNVAMYAASAAGFNIQMQPHHSSSGDLIIRERTISDPIRCNGVTLPGSLIVESTQSVRLRQGCTVRGDVEVGGNLWIERGANNNHTSVHGDILANGRIIFDSPNARVHGNVRAYDQAINPPDLRSAPSSNEVSGSTRISGRLSIPENASLSTPSGCTRNTGLWGRPQVDTSLSGRLCWLQQNGRIGSHRLMEPRNRVEVVPPGVMEWNSFNPQVSDFERIGYRAVTIQGNECSNSAQAVRRALSTGDMVVIDARRCSGGIRINGGGSVTLRNHAVFLTHNLYLNNVTINSQEGRSYQLFAIGPDEGANNDPTCNGGDFRLNENVYTARNTPVMLFSPCLVSIGSNNDFSGQIYAGRYEGVRADGRSSTYIQRPMAMNYDLLPGLPMDLDSRDRLPQEPYIDLESGPVYYRDVVGDS